jgi:hypothetical protein
MRKAARWRQQEESMIIDTIRYENDCDRHNIEKLSGYRRHPLFCNAAIPH